MNPLPRLLALAVLVLVAAEDGYAQEPAAKAAEKPQTPVPAGFALIPAGEFMMGDALDGDKDAPQHKVSVSAFCMQKTEVTKAQWDEVRAWGALNGYIGLATGAGKETYQTGSTGFHPTYAINGDPCTSPVGSFAANGYGLFDMAGNVWEWCWDRYENYILDSQVDPRGSDTDSLRVIRGGGWSLDAVSSRCADRGLWARNADHDVGFRLARGRP